MRRSGRRLSSTSLVLCAVLVGWWAVAIAADGNAANGKKLYLTYCFLCHGKSGKGDGFAASVQPTKPRDLTNDAYMSTRTDQQLFDAISGGGAAFHGTMTMPYWRESLTKEQIWDLVAYIGSISKEPAGPWGKTTSADGFTIEQVPAEFQKTTEPWRYTTPFSYGQAPFEQPKGAPPLETPK